MNSPSPSTGSPSAEDLPELRANLDALTNLLAGHLFALDEELARLAALEARWSEKTPLLTDGTGLVGQGHQIEQSLRTTATKVQLAARLIEQLVTTGGWLSDQIAWLDNPNILR
jgi:hypothetical protein